MNIPLNKTWRSGGVDIRSGSDSSDAGQDPSVTSSGGTYNTQGSSSGSASGSGGSYQWNTSIGSGVLGGTVPNASQTVQNLLTALGYNTPSASLSGFTNKKTNLFSMQFIGFDGFGVVSSTGYENREVLDEQAIAMSSISRTKTGWSPVDIMIMDDDASDVLNILNHQFNVQTSNAETFDMIIEHYDDQGNQTATTYLYGCVIDEFAADPLNGASNNKADMKVILTITPRTVTFS